MRESKSLIVYKRPLFMTWFELMLMREAFSRGDIAYVCRLVANAVARALGIHKRPVSVHAEPRGLINVYTCPVGHRTVTINSAGGTTPFCINCRGNWPGECHELAESSFYRCDQLIERPQWSWYRPTEIELEEMDANVQHYVRSGGLLIRRLDSLTKEALAREFGLDHLRLRRG